MDAVRVERMVPYDAYFAFFFVNQFIADIAINSLTLQYCNGKQQEYVYLRFYHRMWLVYYLPDHSLTHSVNFRCLLKIVQDFFVINAFILLEHHVHRRNYTVVQR